MKKKKRLIIIALAYCNRYLYPLLIVFVPMGLVPIHQSGKLFFLSMGGAVVLFALYQLVGYLLRWTHIFCSIQNAYHLPMTPECVDWGFVKKSEAYGIPAVFGVPGLVLIVMAFVL